MIMDESLEFGDAHSVILATGTHLLPGTIDLGHAGRNPGQGTPLYLVVSIDTEIDSAGDAATLQFRLASDDSAAIDDSASTEHFLSAAFTESQLGQGEEFIFALPIEGLEYEQFLGVQAIVGGETITQGAINAFLTRDPHGYKSYPDGNK